MMLEIRCGGEYNVKVDLRLGTEVYSGFIWLSVWFTGGLLNPVVHLQFP
jgi:hypothetical protein